MTEIDHSPRILITGVGGGVGQSVLKSLQGRSYTLLGADGESLGTGLFASNRGYRIPYARDDEFVPSMLKICEAEHCKLLFPGLDAELPKLAAAATVFAKIGTTVVVSSPDVINIGDDKWKTVQFLTSHGFAAPNTCLLSGVGIDQLSTPVVLKPRKGGARSLGVLLARDRNELERFVSQVDRSNYIAQEYLVGDEFTCGTVTFNGRCYGAIVLRRTLRDGDTYKAFVHRDAIIESYVMRVAEALRPFGACNFQLRLKDGVPCIFEINPRCSGTTFCRTLAGFNEPLMIAEYLLEKKEPRPTEIRPIAVMRYWKEFVVPPQAIEQMQSSGVVEGPSGSL
jgi:carbamoyl-phosphate synthase large subunit